MSVRAAAKRMTTPALFLLAGEDKLVDSAATRRIFTGIAATDKTLVEFPGMFHALTVDLGKEAVFGKLLEWVDKRL